MLENPLFIKEARKIMGREMKHPAMIRQYKQPNYNQTIDEPTKFIGIDFETDSITGDIMLLGVYINNYYYYYFKDDCDLLNKYCMWIKVAIDEGYTLVHWSEFDQYAVLKLFLSELSKEKRERCLNQYDRTIGGKFDTKLEEWIVEPLCKYDTVLKNEFIEFGISWAINKKIYNLYMKKEKMKRPLYVNMINMKPLIKGSLVKACDSHKLTFYTKMDEGFELNGKKYSYHIIDWDLFRNNEDYKKGVLESNKLDCRAVKELSDSYLKMFYKAFNKYPKTIFSSGTLAKMVLSILLSKKDYEDINLLNQFKYWGCDYDNDKRLLCDKLNILACECYSGGLFELFSIGSGECYIADITSCYPTTLSRLYDLRGSELLEGVGIPPKPKNGEYIFIRGTVDMPKEAIHTLNIHNPDYANVITRPYGLFNCSYVWEERQLAIEQGAVFSNEEYIIIKTKGILSPVAEASKSLVEYRIKLAKEGDNTNLIVKDAVNSMYGILIEGTKSYIFEDGNYNFNGFIAGQLYNPIYASLITAYGRIMLCTAMKHIRDNGGHLIQANTDSIHWEGKKSDLPIDFNTLAGPCGWRNEKVLGYFDEPKLQTDFISLAIGRYGGYDSKSNKFYTKLRSYVVNAKNTNYLKDVLMKYMNLDKCVSIPLVANELISPKLANTRLDYDIADVCLIKNRDKSLQVISTGGKRLSSLYTIANPIKIILSKFTDTEPYDAGMFRKSIDGNLIYIRNRALDISSEGKTRIDRRKDTYKKTNERPERKRYLKQYHKNRYYNMTEEQREKKKIRDREYKRKKRN